MSDHHLIEYSEGPYPQGLASGNPPAYPEADPFGGSEQEEPKGAAIQRYIAALLRFKWLILALTFAGASAGVFLAKRLPDEYQAQATLWIETAPRQQSAVQPIKSPELLDSFAWLELLESFAVLDPVVREERLYLDVRTPGAEDATSTLRTADVYTPGAYTVTIDSTGKQFALARLEGELLQRGAVGDSIGPSLGLLWVPPTGSLRPSQVIEFGISPVRPIAQNLADRLQPGVVREVDFLTISLTGTDPVRTANILNAIADQFVAVSSELKSAKLSQLSAILEEQLRVAERSLHEAEVSLEAFKVATITLPSDRGTPLSPGLAMTQDPVYDNFFQIKLDRDQLQRDREVIARVLNDARSGPLSVFALQSVPSLQQAPALEAALAELTAKRAELRALRQRYTDENVQVIRLQKATDELEKGTIPSLATSLLSELNTRDAELAGLIGSVSTELQGIPPRLIEEARLERDVEIAERLYTTLQARYEEARLASVSTTPDVRTLDEATVPPWSTNGGDKIKLLLVCLVGSFGMGVGGAVLLDLLDPKVRYPDQVSSGMGLSILGAVPFVQSAKAGHVPAEAHHAVEAFREVRMNTMYTFGPARSMAITISSAEAGDGKSFVASNLALSFAQQGHRVLLIDGDIRRGRLHHFLKGVRTPGLSDLLAKRVELEQVLQTTDVPLVSLIGSGTRMHVGPELLGSATMSGYLHELQRRFDIIILDTPPLGAGVDPYVLAALTGNLLMVVRTGNTNRAFAEAKLKLLDRLPVRVLGAVLNGIPANHRMYRYYSYLPNYASQEEATQEGTRASLATIS